MAAGLGAGAMSPLTYAPGRPLSAVVFDVGGVTMRAGYAGEEAPRLICSSAVATYTGDDGRLVFEHADPADRALRRRPGLRILRLNECRVADIPSEQLAELVHLALIHGYAHLGVSPEDTPLLLSEPAWEGADNRRALVEMCFKRLRVPALCIARTPELATLASGRTTALVVELGGTAALAVPVIDGVLVNRCLCKSNELGAERIGARRSREIARRVITRAAVPPANPHVPARRSRPPQPAQIDGQRAQQQRQRGRRAGESRGCFGRFGEWRRGCRRRRRVGGAVAP